MKGRFKIPLLLLITVCGQSLLAIVVSGNVIRVSSSRIIPSMARKAGGTWKPKPVPETSSDKVVTANEETTVSYSKYHENANNITGDIFPSSKSFENDEYEYEDSSEEEECPRGQFWHIRGLRCVPLKCPKGGSGRHKDTGECLSMEKISLDKEHVCEFCIKNNIVPYGRCCVSLLRQPNMDTRQLRPKSINYQGIRTKMENRKYRTRG